MELIDDMFEDLKASLGGVLNIYLCERTLHQVVVSYYYDVCRYKWFHSTDRIDGRKQAAFLVKWISKLRPVVLSPAEEYGFFEYFANEVLALKAGLACAEINIETLDDPIVLLTIYSLKYRYMTEGGWILWFETLFSKKGTI